MKHEDTHSKAHYIGRRENSEEKDSQTTLTRSVSALVWIDNYIFLRVAITIDASTVEQKVGS